METGKRSAAATLAAVGVTAGPLAALWRRWRTIRAVTPELRHRGLWLPLHVGNRAMLAVTRRLFSGASEPVPGVVVERRRVPGAQEVFVYAPLVRTRPSGALLWIHGGGMILGSPEGGHAWCSRIARDLGVIVVSAGYRLAPEDPFPAGLEDCHAALRWLHLHAGELGVERARIAVGGASAGGGLAAALAQRVHDEGDLPVAFQLLMYPMLDDRTVARADHGGTGRLAWTPRSNAFAWRCYLGQRPGAADVPPDAAPGRRADLTGLPPAWIGVGDLDLFHEEDVAYAERLRACGVPTELLVVPGMYHGGDGEFDDTVPTARDFRAAILDALDRALSSAPAV